MRHDPAPGTVSPHTTRRTGEMPEGLSPVEVGHEVAEHAKHAGSGGDGESRAHAGRDRGVSIAEAVLLSLVTLMAAWSGYAAAKWSTESRGPPAPGAAAPAAAPP